MKKILLTGAVTLLSTLSFSQALAGGGMMIPNYTYDQSDLNLAIDSIQDKDLKDLISKNVLPATQNNITEDYDFNNKTYYTKKLNIAASIPTAIQDKVVKAYISLWVAQNNGMPMMDSMKTEAIGTSAGNEVVIDINKSSIPSELKIKREMLDGYIKDQYGASFNGKLILELSDGTKLPYSNMISLYMTKDNMDGKIAQLQNLYYVANPNGGWANTADLLKKIFEKLQAKYKKTYDYVSVLEKVMKRIDTRLETTKASQTKMVESIKSEEDFPKYVDDAGKLMDKTNILNDIKYQLASEIKTKQSEGVIDDLFTEDTDTKK